jgi:hypothetical protein
MYKWFNVKFAEDRSSHLRDFSREIQIPIEPNILPSDPISLLFVDLLIMISNVSNPLEVFKVKSVINLQFFLSKVLDVPSRYR